MVFTFIFNRARGKPREFTFLCIPANWNALCLVYLQFSPHFCRANQLGCNRNQPHSCQTLRDLRTTKLSYILQDGQN